MPTPHYCRRSGYLLGPDGRVSEDPAEFYLGEEQVVVGCNRLRCGRCGQLVGVERDPLPEEQEFRAYRCDCVVHRENGPSRPADFEDPDTYESALPWACAGHPAATLPLDLDGIRIAPDTDFPALMRRTLAGWSPELARPGERSSPVGWAIKLFVRLLDTGIEQRVSTAAAACITDADPRVRAAALWFVAAFPEAAGAERVEDHVAGDRTLFAGVPDPTASASCTLETRLLRALGRRVLARDGAGRVKAARALDLAKAEALRPGQGTVLFSFLADADPDWLAANAAAIARTGPEAWVWLMSTIPDDRLAEVARQLAAVPRVDRARLRK
ncbi:MAG: hypothetical protein FJ029_15595, partial [Actinobacteria bacterium]|nr:hypothetical protein [Actinomycetota bacterium]